MGEGRCKEVEKCFFLISVVRCALQLVLLLPWWRGKEAIKGLLSFWGEKRKISKQVNVSKTASKGTDSANTINQRDCLHKSIHIWMCLFSQSLQLNQRLFHTSRKGKKSDWSRGKKKKKNQHDCAGDRRTGWPLHRRTVSSWHDFTHRSLPL